jgi:hypothetical protein
MKRLLVFMLVAAGFAVPVSAHAATVTQTVPFDAVVTACNGDSIHLNGSLLLASSVNTTPSGGFMVSSHFQPQGVSGVNLRTGAKFIGTGVTRDIVIMSPAGGITDTFVNQFRVQATAGGQSFVVTQLVHVTVNANGAVTAVVDQFSTSC